MKAYFPARLFARDLSESIRQSDVRKAENVAAMTRMQSNKELCGALMDAAHRRGQSEINWREYFRNIRLL